MIVRIVAQVVGAALVVGIVLSAIRTFVVPRALPVRLTRLVFVSVRGLFDVIGRRLPTYERRDSLLALYAPISLVMLPFAWLVVVGTGFTLMFWGAGVDGWRNAFALAGSSLLTLGFAEPGDVPNTAISFLAAVVGLGLIALLVSYLPTIYAAFSRRETAVALLEVRAGTPPSAVAMLERYHRIHGLDELNELWPLWEQWFADVDESHTSLASLAFFRAPQPDRSWVTAAGAVLDAASLVASSLDRPRVPEAELCVRSGYVAFRHLADFFGIEYDPNPERGDPISIDRAEWDEACDYLASIGVPIRSDRDEAWLDFAGWRVNYDTVLLGLAALVVAPPAPWSSDRAPDYQRPPLLRRRKT